MPIIEVATETQDLRSTSWKIEPLKDYHHFKKDRIDAADKVARCERHVIDLLLSSDLSDSQRDSSVAFELRHHSSVKQMARILARKRNLPLVSCTIGALLHDIYVIVNGSYKDHAHMGAPIARNIIEKIGGFTESEKSHIDRIVYDHSDKHIWTTDPFREFGKDADVLDCFLYPGGFGYYLRYKPLDVFQHYINRARKVWRELGIPEDREFSILDNYNSYWFDLQEVLTFDILEKLLRSIFHLISTMEGGPCPPSFAVLNVNGRCSFFTNSANWEIFLENYGRSIIGEKDLKVSHALRLFEGNKLLRNNSLSSANELSQEDHRSQRKDIIDMASTLVKTIVRDDLLLVFWSSLSSYELLTGEQKLHRIKELGIREIF